MKTAIVYHKIDFDGICSMSVVRQWAEKNGDDVTTIGFNHGEAVPSLEGFDKVFVVDISFPEDEMIRLRDRMVWIDHHRTAIASSLEGGYADIPGLRREGVGACELCWEWCHPNVKVPPFVALLSAYDVWDKERFHWNHQTLPFQMGMRNRYNLDAEAFYRDFINDDERYDSVMREGAVILKYVRQSGAIGCKAYGFEITFAGVKALCLLTPSFGGLAMEASAVERGCPVVVCANRCGDDAWKVSAYAANGDSPVDIGSYLKERYGGGGHPNAGGCTIGQSLFIEKVLDGKAL